MTIINGNTVFVDFHVAGRIEFRLNNSEKIEKFSGNL